MAYFIRQCLTFHHTQMNQSVVCDRKSNIVFPFHKSNYTQSTTKNSLFHPALYQKKCTHTNSFNVNAYQQSASTSSSRYDRISIRELLTPNTIGGRA